MKQFSPPLGLRSGGMQTVVGSTLRKYVVQRRVSELCSVEQEHVFTANDGAKLAVWISKQAQPAPLVVVIHGWLGTHNSGYNLSLANELWNNGFSVARLNLRDHGGTAHLNEGMFHNGLIEEVVDVIKQLRGQFESLGVVGFSLGGNFALRIAKHTGVPALGICPLMDPASSVLVLDRGVNVYKGYFMRKWRKAMDEKSKAFPEVYDFQESGAYQLDSVHGMTKHFVEHYTHYESLQSYYNCYTLTGDFLNGVCASILAAADDPVVPEEAFRSLPGTIDVTLLSRGGHCAFLDGYGMTSYADRFATDFCKQALR